MAKKVTMRDIAKEINVSAVTVSKALTDKEGVSEEVRKKIKEKAKEMGYLYNSMAKSMREGINYNIGIIVADRFFEDNSFYSNLYRHIVLRLNEINYFGILEILSEEQELQGELPSVISHSKIDGLIVMGQVEIAYLKRIRKTEIPYVLLDFYVESEKVDAVVTDNVFGSYLLTNGLLKAGHRDIVFVGDIHATSSIMDRMLGALKSFIQFGIPHREDWIISDRDEAGEFVNIKLPKDMPTAFVCNCDQAAFLLIRQLKEEGYRVPEDISVVGFDDYVYSTLSNPQLTTFRVNVEGMADVAVKTLIAKIEKEEYPMGRQVIGGEVVHRDSIGTRKIEKS